MVKKGRIKILKPGVNKHPLKSRRTGSNIERHLVENMVHLQKVHADMAVKFDKLSKQISDLLVLFEMSARSFNKQQISPIVTERDKEFVDKIDKLLDQNKLIARGLTLMDDKMRERVYGSNENSQPVQQMQMQRAMPMQMISMQQPQPQMQSIQNVSQMPNVDEEMSIANKPEEKENSEDKPSPPVSRPLPRF